MFKEKSEEVAAVNLCHTAPGPGVPSVTGPPRVSTFLLAVPIPLTPLSWFSPSQGFLASPDEPSVKK